MSLQWTLVAACMYVELAVTILLLLPLVSPKRWNSFFKSRFLASFVAMSGVYFKIFFGILVLCLFDAIREMHKYGGEAAPSGHSHDTHLDVEMQTHMRLFRAQRNFYISGFALVLAGVLYRLTSLISSLATAQASAEAALKQAKSASDAASALMDTQGGDKDDAKSQKSSAAAEALAKELSEENERLKRENSAALGQAEGVRREYDRLLEEHARLQGQAGDKKDD